MRIGIYGYGNVGRGVESACTHHEDAELIGIFTRRDPASITSLTSTPIYSVDSLADFQDKIDVLILCGGSATDLPELTHEIVRSFNTVDSFDTHTKIPEYFAAVDAAAKESGHIAVISSGWDPGLFSLNRVYAEAILPGGSAYTFWGRGVSQGHSDAIRRIEGVLDARQYTVPVPAALDAVRNGDNPQLSVRQKHTRECFVVAAAGSDLNAITEQIKTMPNYFEEYDTTVTFITAEEMLRDHAALPHGGSVIYSGTTGLHNEHTETIEYSLKLDSNPEFTASVLVATARAAARMATRGISGAKTLLDIAPVDLCARSAEELRSMHL